MQKGVVVVSAAAAVLGLAAAVLGFAAEVTASQPLVSSDGSRCEYPRTPALGFGAAAAALSLTGLALVTAASGCFGRCAAGRRRSACAIKVLAIIAWLLAVESTASFLYGAWRNAGGTTGLSPVRRARGSGGRTYDYEFGCTEPRRGVFASASIGSAIAIACVIAAYVELHKTDQPFGQSIEMGQQPPHVAYPYGGYFGDKQPGGTA